jgi:hypothetical protein
VGANGELPTRGAGLLNANTAAGPRSPNSLSKLTSVPAAVGALLAATIALASAGAAAGSTATPGAPQWSPPAVVSTCTAVGAPRVVFPSNLPNRSTGPGAIVWSAPPTCPGGEGARVTMIGAGAQPGATRIPSTSAGKPIAPREPLTVADGPHGEIVIAGTSPTTLKQGLVIQGSAGGPFSALATVPGSAAPFAMTTAYLGDVALASPAPAAIRDGEPRVLVERFFTHNTAQRVATDSANARSQSAGRTGPDRTGPVSDLTLAMDFRSDALAVWVQKGSIFAQDLPASGARHPIERLGAAGPGVHIATLLSDDNRAIVAWAQDSGGQTSVYLDRSATGVRFGTPRLLERFSDPDGLSSPTTSPQLVRLSSESVMMAWSGSAEGHWAVRTAAVDLDGIGAFGTISTPGQDALLADLAPGPDDDAIVLWGEPQPDATGEPTLSDQALFAARGIDTFPDHTIFGAPEELAPAGPNSEATVALDPDSDRAVAVWRGEGSTLRYAIRSTAPPVG